MKVSAAAIITALSSSLNGCRATPSLRATDSEDENHRKLQTSDHVTITSPLNYDGYWRDILFPEYNEDTNTICYNQVLSTVGKGGPTTAQLLVMFRDNFVEHKGKVYASLSNNVDYDAPELETVVDGGLYEVTDQSPGTCVQFQLIYPDANIGQIVASSQFDPIEIIGVSGETIHGYYPSSSGSSWLRKATAWGNAKDGSLAAEPALSDDAGAGVSGLSCNDRLFNLWGDFNNFNYAKHDHIQCSARPATIGDWTGSLAGSRGVYCPRVSNNQLKKYTWHGSGAITTDVGWEPASRIGRLSPTSNIYGISTDGNPLVLWDEKGVAVHSAPIHLDPELTQVLAIGGVDNGYARGFFASNSEDRVYNVYWDGAWKTTEMPIYFETQGIMSVFFGNYNDKTYVLYGAPPTSSNSPSEYSLYRLDFVGGSARHDAVWIQSGTSAVLPPSSPKIVTLGDSYSSGTGIYQLGNQYDEVLGGYEAPWKLTARADNECWRETDDLAGPEYANQQGIPSVFLACKGAELVSNVGSCDQFEPFANQIDLLDSMYPSDAAAGWAGSTILFTIGGNDVRSRDGEDWPSMVERCILSSDCHEDWENEVANFVDVGDRLDAAYEKLALSAHGAKIRVMGYPRLFQRYTQWYIPSKCPAVTGINKDEADFFDDSVDTLNAIMNNSVNTVKTNHPGLDIKFVSVTNYITRGACRTSGREINDKVCKNTDTDICFGDNVSDSSFHPSRAGYNKYEDAFRASL